MKVNDLKENSLVGVKVKIPISHRKIYPELKEAYIFSWWAQGIWFKKKMSEGQIYPVCMDPKELLQFTVVK